VKQKATLRDRGPTRGGVVGARVGDTDRPAGCGLGVVENCGPIGRLDAELLLCGADPDRPVLPAQDRVHVSRRVSPRRMNRPA
jgi:hypothetical protein